MSDTLAKDGRKNEEDLGERNEFFMHRSFPCRLSDTPAASPSFFWGPLSIPSRAHARTENRNGKKGSARLLDFMACFMASNIAGGVVFYEGNCDRGSSIWSLVCRVLPMINCLLPRLFVS